MGLADRRESKPRLHFQRTNTSHQAIRCMVRRTLAGILAYAQAFLCSALISGCGTSATVTTGPTIHSGRLLGLDSHGDLIVRTGEKEATAVRRSRIKDIDHPGNVLATFGALLGGYGVANAIVGLPGCRERVGGVAFCFGAISPLVAGLAMLAYGLNNWIRSKNATERTLDRRELQGYSISNQRIRTRPQLVPSKTSTSSASTPPGRRAF